jgi:hypothetical protein
LATKANPCFFKHFFTDMRNLYPLFLLCLLSFTAVKAQTVYYTVTFPNDTTVFGCGATAPLVQPIIDKVGSCGLNVAVNRTDNIFYTSSCQNCYKIERRWRLVYWCDYDPNWRNPVIIPNPGNTDKGVTAVGNSNNRGFIEYTQVIKVLDNVAPIFVNCPTSPVTVCDLSNNRSNQYNNGHTDRCESPVDISIKAIDACSKAKIRLTYRLFLDLDGNGSMETLLSSSSANAFPVETTTIGDTLMGRIKFPTNYELPYGRHKVEWIANDNCTSESVCKYELIIKDCKRPTAVCCNPLSATLMQTGMLTLRDSTFLLYGFDNCSPARDLKTGIRRSGTGTGFPTDQTVNFTCDEVGSQVVEVWVRDAAGNADFCKAIVQIQDNMGNCVPPGTPTGTITTEFNKPVPGVSVTLRRQSANQPFNVTETTTATGRFSSNIEPVNCNFTIIPRYDSLATWGVSMADVHTLVAHVEGVQLIESPYSQLAGDVNRDNKLDFADVKLIERMVNGEISTFPGVDAWRFVPVRHDFRSDNPFQFPVPGTITQPCTPGYQQDFFAIKMGDVNGSVKNFTGAKDSGNNVEDRSATAQNTLSATTLTISPNPVPGRARVSFFLSEAGPVVLSAVDVTGKTTVETILQLEKGYQEQWLDFPTSGIQLLRLQTANGMVTKKVVVEK